MNMVEEIQAQNIFWGQTLEDLETRPRNLAYVLHVMVSKAFTTKFI